VRSHYHTRPEAIDEYDWAVEAQTIESLVIGYNWRWGAFPADTTAPMHIVGTEKLFRLPLLNPATGAASTVWELAGKIDGIVTLDDGRLAVLEHKFISDAIDQDSDYWRRLQLDSQISLYVYAARQLGYDVETVLYDVVRKPTIRPEQVPILDADGLKIVLDEQGQRVMTKQGKPRQTGDSSKGYLLQSRLMTPEEWSQKLLADIGERPGWYYARQEIPRLDSDIDELLDEIWDVQKTLRDAQLRNRWYKTVSRDTCSWCPYFGLCSSRFDPSTGEVPEGFIWLKNPHPELEKVIV